MLGQEGQVALEGQVGQADRAVQAVQCVLVPLEAQGILEVLVYQHLESRAGQEDLVLPLVLVNLEAQLDHLGP